MGAFQLLFQTVHAIFKSAEFRLLNTQLLLRLHFSGLPLLFFRRQILEFCLESCNVCWSDFRDPAFHTFLITFQTGRQVPPVLLCLSES